ncbi:MAG TPA: hypothetical protein VE650_17000, partial [Acetobacteraceae bacterium]|nr:hypothetical protein [Acetobacteraceae bacterium]
MPVARKPRNKKQPTTQASSALPDRRVMESYLAAITGAKQDEAIERAQEMIYDAWEQRTSRSRVALARKALAISPLCADAYNLLAGEAASPAEAREFYERGLAAAELVLGREGFEEYAGQFWGFLETRPYMRARRGLAITLLQAGEEDAAIGHLRAMLELNPGDNQGIRYVLLATLLRRDEIEAAKTLLAAYEEDWSNEWL